MFLGTRLEPSLQQLSVDRHLIGILRPYLSRLLLLSAGTSKELIVHLVYLLAHQGEFARVGPFEAPAKHDHVHDHGG